MPANLKGTRQIINRLPKNKLYILDQTNEELSSYPTVYQNFKNDIYQGLLQGLHLINPYQKIILLFSDHKQAQGVLEGFNRFCTNHNFHYEVIANLNERTLQKGEVYIVLDDRDLIRIIKKLKQQADLILAKDIGIISDNETLLKEIVEDGITTISTDFNLMGTRLASMILNNEFDRVENQSKLIVRKSL
jgi:DNA-binding LacI/PurR family transcriptional regulator